MLPCFAAAPDTAAADRVRETTAFAAPQYPNRERMEQHRAEEENPWQCGGFDRGEPGFESYSSRFLRRGDSASEEEDSIESPAESVTIAAARVFKRDNLGRFAVAGANRKNQMGGRGSGENPKNLTTKSHTPLKAAMGAKNKTQVDAAEKVITRTAIKGGVRRMPP